MSRQQAVPKPNLLTTQSEITALCDTCAREGRFGFDTEFVMEDRFEAEACLLQIATAESVALIDPFLELDLKPVWKMVCSPEVETIVHAGQEDLALAVQQTGDVPQNIFDLQIAAGLAGFDYPLSLMKLVQSTRHIRLHKSKTLTDWRRRPLGEAQLHYAAEDVQHLHGVYRVIQRRLAQRDRLDWATEEFRRYEDPSLYRKAPEDGLVKIKGAGGLSPRPLAITRALLGWRDELGRHYNRPARVLLKDHLLVEIAKHELTTFAEIRELRGITLRDADVRRLAAAVKEAKDSPPESWPRSRPREITTPPEEVLVALITSVIRSFCMEHNLAYGLVATKRSIQQLIRHRTHGAPSDPADVELLRGWRGQTVGAMADDVLAGRNIVRVEMRADGPIVRVQRDG